MLPAAPFDPPLYRASAAEFPGGFVVLGTRCAVQRPEGIEEDVICEPGDLAAARFDLRSFAWTKVDLPDSPAQGQGPETGRIISDGRSSKAIVSLNSSLFRYDSRADGWTSVKEPFTAHFACQTTHGYVIVDAPTKGEAGRQQPRPGQLRRDDPAATTPSTDTIRAAVLSDDGRWSHIATPADRGELASTQVLFCTQDKVHLLGTDRDRPQSQNVRYSLVFDPASGGWADAKSPTIDIGYPDSFQTRQGAILTDVRAGTVVFDEEADTYGASPVAVHRLGDAAATDDGVVMGYLEGLPPRMAVARVP